MADFLHRSFFYLMKPLKRLACLVTLQFMCGLTLQAAAPQEFRQWTDVNGRTMTARLIALPNAESVKIERLDGQVFTVPLTRFSPADQDHVNAYRAERSEENPSGDTTFKEPDTATWTLLNSGGSQPASAYDNTSLDLIIEGINRRFSVKKVKTPEGTPLTVRTEPSNLAARIRITGDLPRMSLSGFVQEVARTNNLKVKTDRSGLVVLVDNEPPADKPVASLFGVPANPN